MSSVVDFNNARVRPTPIDVQSADDFEGKTPPPLRWIMRNMAPRKNVSLFMGQGGTNKTTLLMQTQVALALGHRDLLGMELPGVPTTSLALYCEDDQDEIHRRFFKVCRYYGTSFRALDGRVRFLARANEVDSALMRFNTRDYNGVLTGLYHQVADIIKEERVELTIIDNANHVYQGEENQKAHVVPFVNALRRLSAINEGAVILVKHPSQTGLNTGTGTSGSRAWEDSVRCRVYMSKPKQEKDGPPIDKDERILKVMKSNYGPSDGETSAFYRDGVLIPRDPSPAPYYVDRD